MSKILKKSLAIITILAMMFCTVPFAASAESYSGTCGDNLAWTLDAETGVLDITGTGEMTNWDLSSSNAPWYSYSDSIKTVSIATGVITIGDFAFYYCDSLTSVTIPDSIKTIGVGAFSNCYSLTSVTIPDSVTTIGERAFYHCTSLESITIPDSVTSIPVGAFQGCQLLTNVTIPNSVTTLGDSAFSNCDSLTNVTIPDSVITIGELAFYHCGSLTSITVDANNKNYSSDSYGVLFNKDKTTLIQYPIGNTRTNYTIPDSVTTISNYALWTCNNLTSVIIPDSVTTIGDWAFYNCDSLTSVTIGNSVTSIGYYAFYYCDSLTSVTIGNSVTSIGYYAFYYCDSLTSVTIPDSVTTIGCYAFYNCNNLTSVTIPDSVRIIGDYAFCVCDSLTDVYYGSTEEDWNKISIGSDNESLSNANIHFTKSDIYSGTCGENITWSFDENTGVLTITGTGAMELAPWYSYADKIKTINIEKGVTSISDHAFQGCQILTSVTISDSVTTIGKYAFDYCLALTNITIPDSVTTIKEHAFGYCFNLTNITIPNSVTSISELAFHACGNLTRIDVSEGNEYYSNDIHGVLFNKNQTELIFYPGGNKRTSYIVPDSVTTIGEVAFYEGSALEYIHIHTGVKEIAEYIGVRSSTYICSATQDCYAKTYADENGIEFRVCKGHGADEPVYIEKTSDNGIKVEYDSSYFENNDNIVLRSEKQENGNFSGFDGQTGFVIAEYDICLEDTDGNEIKHTGESVEYTVSIPVPAECESYEKFIIIHWIIDNGKKKGEPLGYEVKDGYIVFKTKSFSYFDICIFGFEQKAIELNYKDSASVAATKDSTLSVIYTSSNPKVVTVDENGNLTTTGRGTATITATVETETGENITDTCEVTVKFTFWQWIIYILFLGFLWY